jgi:hypothetical protein
LACQKQHTDQLSTNSYTALVKHIPPGNSFVDDTTYGATYDDTTAEPNSSNVQELAEREEELIGHMEEIRQYFLDLLQVTGAT